MKVDQLLINCRFHKQCVLTTQEFYSQKVQACHMVILTKVSRFQGNQLFMLISGAIYVSVSMAQHDR